MELSHVIEDQICIVTIDGSLASVEDVEEVESYANSALEEEPLSFLVLNLEKIDYINSLGMSLLVMFHEKLKGKLALCKIPPDELETFEFMKLDSVFSIYATEEETLKALKEKE